MIIAKHVSKRYGRLQALDNVSVQFNKGECVALVGPNASGKTTFIKSILGMVIPDAGSISFNGVNIKSQWQYRNLIGYMPQIGRYPDNMTIGQVLDMMKDVRRRDTRLLDETLVHNFDLPAMMHKRMRTLSGGTRQKVSASLAFLFNPEVLILDEPTAGLDPLSSEILKEKIAAEKEKGRLILITSHVLSELDDLVTHVLYLQEGKICFNESTDTLREQTGHPKLSKAIASIMADQQR